MQRNADLRGATVWKTPTESAGHSIGGGASDIGISKLDDHPGVRSHQRQFFLGRHLAKQLGLLFQRLGLGGFPCFERTWIHRFQSSLRQIYHAHCKFWEG